jgi:hypothetical protein
MLSSAPSNAGSSRPKQSADSTFTAEELTNDGRRRKGQGVVIHHRPVRREAKRRADEEQKTSCC